MSGELSKSILTEPFGQFILSRESRAGEEVLAGGGKARQIG
jgi:hypothetical protein